MDNSIRIEKADDGTFIIRRSKQVERKGKDKDKVEHGPSIMMDYKEETYTAKDMDRVIEIVREEMGDDEEGSEEEKVKKAWDKETKK
mgnify:CR=1 FL=1